MKKIDHIYFFTENYSYGGANKYLIDMANSLVSECSLLTINANPHGIFDTDRKNANSSIIFSDVFFIKWGSFLRCFTSLKKKIRRIVLALALFFSPIPFIINTLLFYFLLKKIKPSLIFSCNGGYPASIACISMVLAAKLQNIPVILSIVSIPSMRLNFFPFYGMMLDKITWYSANKVITNADAISKDLEKFREMDQTKSFVVKNGVADIIENKRRTPPEKNEITIGCITRLDLTQGVKFLVLAFSKILKIFPNIKLVLAGGVGDASKEITQMITELRLEKNVSLLGYFQGSKTELLLSFDIYVFPSIWAGLPYNLLEAMSAGCPIIASQVGGIPEAIEDQKEGLLVSPGNVIELYEAIHRLISDREFRTILGMNARKRYEQEFTLENMQYAVKKAVKTVLND